MVDFSNLYLPTASLSGRSVGIENQISYGIKSRSSSLEEIPAESLQSEPAANIYSATLSVPVVNGASFLDRIVVKTQGIDGDNQDSLVNRLQVAFPPEPDVTVGEQSLELLSEGIWIALYWYFQFTAGQLFIPVNKGKPVSERRVELVLDHQMTPALPILQRLGLVEIERRQEAIVFVVYAACFWQLAPELFVRSPDCHRYLPPKPLRYTISKNAIRHPQRPLPPPAKQPFYSRHCISDKLNAVFRLRPVDMSDLELIHTWMNNPRVSEFWGEQGPIEHQRKFLETCMASQHSFTAIGSWNDLDADGNLTTWRDACFFDIYWVKEDRLSSYANGVQDWDRGVHLLVGEDWARGRSKAWLDSIVHYMFLDDPRTQSLYLEPRVDNERFINLLTRYGFHKVKDFAFPHKQAALMKLDREYWIGCSS